MVWPADWISLFVALATIGGLSVVAARAFQTGPAVERAIDTGLGPRWREEISSPLAGRLRRRLPQPRISVPWPFRPRAVERVSNIRYGDAAKQTLDVYRHRSKPTSAPTLNYLHGGGFTRGRKSFEARPLIHHLASQGWTCISANYHLAARPGDGFPQHLIDVKKLIGWVRVHRREHGVDPGMVFLAGSSAGAHLTAMAAMTVNDPTFQLGFEVADSAISAGICLYGYYGALGNVSGPPSDPLHYSASTASPLFILHGDHDTYTPVADTHRFVARLRSVARPGA